MRYCNGPTAAKTENHLVVRDDEWAMATLQQAHKDLVRDCVRMMRFYHQIDGHGGAVRSHTYLLFCAHGRLVLVKLTTPQSYHLLFLPFAYMYQDCARCVRMHTAYTPRPWKINSSGKLLCGQYISALPSCIYPQLGSHRAGDVMGLSIVDRSRTVCALRWDLLHLPVVQGRTLTQRTRLLSPIWGLPALQGLQPHIDVMISGFLMRIALTHGTRVDDKVSDQERAPLRKYACECEKSEAQDRPSIQQ